MERKPNPLEREKKKPKWLALETHTCISSNLFAHTEKIACPYEMKLLAIPKMANAVVSRNGKATGGVDAAKRHNLAYGKEN